MADQKIGFGIIGANLNYGWGSRAHLPALAALPDYELAAVCTAHRETAEATAGQFDFKRAYWDYRALVEDPAVQVVDVCVRTAQHYPLVKAALEAGKHVYCEWPLGRSLEETEELAALARAKGVQTMVGLQGRGTPSVRWLRDMVAEGFVGKVVSANMTHFTAGVLRPRTTAAAWNANPAGGNSILTIATGHELDVFCWCLGDFAELAASVSTQVPEWPLSDSDRPAQVTVPDNVLITGRLRNGAVASLHIANIPWHTRPSQIEVYGTEGTIVATIVEGGFHHGVTLQAARYWETALHDMPVPDRLRWLPGGVPAGVAVNVAQMLAGLARAIRTGEAVQPDFTEAARHYRLLDAIQRASDTRSWVSFEAEG